jgi:hypothetical protein
VLTQACRSLVMLGGGWLSSNGVGNCVVPKMLPSVECTLSKRSSMLPTTFRSLLRVPSTKIQIREDNNYAHLSVTEQREFSMVSNGVRKPIFIELELRAENITGDNVNRSQRCLESFITAALQRCACMGFKGGGAV